MKAMRRESFTTKDIPLLSETNDATDFATRTPLPYTGGTLVRTNGQTRKLGSRLGRNTETMVQADPAFRKSVSRDV